MFQNIAIIVLTIAQASIAPAHAGGAFAVSGYYKNFSIVTDPVEYVTPMAAASSPLAGSVTNRLRLDCVWTLSENASFQFAYDFIPRIEDASLVEENGFSPLRPNPLVYRIADLDQLLHPDHPFVQGSFSILQNLDRARLSVRTAIADITVGRQAIAWGSARVINPTDVLAPFAFSELDIEDRTGIDAVRVRIPTGIMGEVDLGYVCGKDARLDESAIYARSKFYAAKTDITFMTIDFRENLLAGIDLARSIGGAGAWIECAAVFVDAFHGSPREDTRNYAGVTCGLDYNLTAALYGFCEYHFNTSGTSKSETYIANTTGPAYREGGAYLLGTHYLAPGMTLQVTPLTTFSAQALWNLTDTSVLLAPRLDYNVAENVFLEAGCYLGLGKRAAVTGASITEPDIIPHSEFGLYPGIYFTSFRVYF